MGQGNVLGTLKIIQNRANVFLSQEIVADLTSSSEIGK